MMQNGSVPANVLLPHLVYEDVAEVIAWLARVFGFREHYRYGDPERDVAPEEWGAMVVAE
jgi:uncharacterized glyoxalase superfamily protein PhnB